MEGIYQATPAMQDTALLGGATAIAASCVAQIRTLPASIVKLDHQIQPLAHNHPEALLFAELREPVRPRLIVGFGTQMDRYATASEMQAYSGIAPITQSSGHTRCVHVRSACPTFLRQTFSRVCCLFDLPLRVGPHLLGREDRRQVPPRGHPSPGVQVDSGVVPLLERRPSLTTNRFT
jgi:hypothetical protein